MSFLKLRSQIKELESKLEPFDNLVETRSAEYEASHIVNNAMAVWSAYDQFLDMDELKTFQTLNHERLLLAQELGSIYQQDLMENRKERMQLKRALRKVGIVIGQEYDTDLLMTSEIRELAIKHGVIK